VNAEVRIDGVITGSQTIAVSFRLPPGQGLATTTLDEVRRQAPPGLIIQRRRATGNLKPMRFVSLHHHSTFSYLDGVPAPGGARPAREELNMGASPDRARQHRLARRASRRPREAGVKPIFGCEVYMPTTSVTRTASGPLVDDAPRRSEAPPDDHREDAGGLRNLLQLVTKSWQNFYHDPIVTWTTSSSTRRG
jgi:DNA polymerase III alpha subunit